MADDSSGLSVAGLACPLRLASGMLYRNLGHSWQDSLCASKNPPRGTSFHAQSSILYPLRLQRKLDAPQFHSYCAGVKNITLSVGDELYEQSRVLAAQRKTTVTGLVREYLQSLSGAEQRREQARSEILKMIRRFDGKIGRMPTREERNARR